jgi:26S proteasome regulatory subunit N5
MGILANKVNRKMLEEAGFEPQRLRFFALMAQLAHHGRDALTLAKHCQAVLATRGLAADGAAWKPVLESMVLYAALAPWSNESSDMLARVRADVRLEDVSPAYRTLADLLSTPELIPWPLPPATAQALAAHEAFAMDLSSIGGVGAGGVGAGAGAGAGGAGGSDSAMDGSAAAGSGEGVILAEDEPRAARWWPVLRKRVLQHNLRTLAGAYSCARLARLEALTGVGAAVLEAQLSELVASGAVYARINRPAGVANFRRSAPAVQVLDAWSSDLGECLERVERVVHLLRKEEQLAEAAAGGGGAAGSGARA